jgi:hypothetical protein
LENEIDFAGYSSFPSTHLVIYRPLSDHLFRCNFTICQKNQVEKNWLMKSSSKEKDRICHEIFQSVTPLIREVVNTIISYTKPIFSETSLNMCAYIFNFADRSNADPQSIKVEDCIIFEKCYSAKLKMNFSVSNTEKEKTVSATMINLNTLTF